MLHSVHCSTHIGYLFYHRLLVFLISEIRPQSRLSAVCLLFFYDVSLGSYESCASRSGGIRGSAPPRACDDPSPGQPSATAEHPRNGHVHPGGSEGHADDCWSNSELFDSACPGNITGLCLLLLFPFGGVPFLLGGCSCIFPIEGMCGSSLFLCTLRNLIRSDQSSLFFPSPSLRVANNSAGHSSLSWILPPWNGVYGWHIFFWDTYFVLNLVAVDLLV